MFFFGVVLLVSYLHSPHSLRSPRGALRCEASESSYEVLVVFGVSQVAQRLLCGSKPIATFCLLPRKQTLLIYTNIPIYTHVFQAKLDKRWSSDMVWQSLSSSDTQTSSKWIELRIPCDGHVWKVDCFFPSYTNCESSHNASVPPYFFHSNVMTGRAAQYLRTKPRTSWKGDSKGP